MPNSKNKASSSHADAAATSANEKGFFNFSFPHSTKPIRFAHPSAEFLSLKEKEQFAYEMLDECIIPAYNRQGLNSLLQAQPPAKNPVLEEIRKWSDKAEYKELIWNMLYGFIVELPTGWDEHTKGAAMSMYKFLDELAEYIYD